jgi:hypothetical protein
MKTTHHVKTLFAAGFVACLTVGVSFPVQAQEKADSPRSVSETTFFKDMSTYFYQTLPFFKKGLRFLDSSQSLEYKEGTVNSLVVESGDKKEPNDPVQGQPIHVTKDIVPFIDAIKTEEDALAYVRFLSRKGYPWMEPMRFDYFQDVPFLPLEFTAVSTTTVAANSIPAPRVVLDKGSLFKKKRFTIVRTVVPLDQPNLKEEKILSGKNPLELTEVAEVTETVMEDGTYSYSLRRVPVKNFPIGNPLISIRKEKK